MATLIERSVDAYAPYIMLIFIDVIEFRGRHIHAFYEAMPARFAAAYEKNFARKRREGRLGDANALVAVMLATRWLFYYFTVEKCFGVPMHFGMAPREAVKEFIRILRLGVLPGTAAARADLPGTATAVEAT
jgi:hypothetical protein